jgi:hypothetical protein
MNITTTAINNGRHAFPLPPASLWAQLASLVLPASKGSLLSSSRRFATVHLPFTAVVLCLQCFWPRFFSVVTSIVSSSWETYLYFLETRPMLTKALSTGVIGAIGDILAQHVEIFSNRSKITAELRPSTRKSNEQTETVNRKKSKQKIDKWRAGMNAVDGILFTGPFMHFAYELMERQMPTLTGSSQSYNAWLQLAVDNILLDSIFVSWAIISSGILEGYSLRREIIPQFKHDFGPAIMAGVSTNLLVAPLEYYCFRYMPLQFRVLAINCIDVLWDAVVSLMAHRSRKPKSEIS